mmetsp:Transcript_127761/g.361634  ORF Transcript_127761/g.361634 Transcript_127761/m.361634 type:complete len:216 (+) Transcript_127761:556-1203(+)
MVRGGRLRLAGHGRAVPVLPLRRPAHGHAHPRGPARHLRVEHVLLRAQALGSSPARHERGVQGAAGDRRRLRPGAAGLLVHGRLPRTEAQRGVLGHGGVHPEPRGHDLCPCRLVAHRAEPGHDRCRDHEPHAARDAAEGAAVLRQRVPGVRLHAPPGAPQADGRPGPACTARPAPRVPARVIFFRLRRLTACSVAATDPLLLQQKRVLPQPGPNP